jgi:hypothetical protein|tara:strand:+ start:2690 stop:2998 length:309 start_codon:yes stop_codon:yes gene_type:complete
MDIEFTNEDEVNEQLSTLNEAVDESDSELKTYIVNYVGSKVQPENAEVTVKMVVETLAVEFPEFILALAEENWVRGYEQALADVDTGKKLMEEKLNENESEE